MNVRFKDAVTIYNGKDYKHIESDTGFPVMGSGGQFAYASDYLYDGEVILLGRKGTIDRPLYYVGKFWSVDTMYYAVPKLGFCGKFLYYCSLNFPFLKYSTATALPSMTKSVLERFTLPDFILSQQEAIAAYLDRECEKIGQQIELLERKADAYKRLRRSIINRAVTRGLNPNVPLKPSGIDWVGKIPEHWNVSRFAHYFSEHNISNKGVNHQNLLSLSFGKIIRKNIYTCDGLLPASFETYQIVEPGNIILRFTDLQNDHRSLRVGLVREEGIITSAYTCVEGNNNTIPEFSFYLLHSYDIKKVFYKLGGGMRQTLNYKTTKDMGVVFPPIEEQREIVAYLDEKCSKIDAIIEKIGTKIERLKELKRSLINEVVTGKRAINII